ncbi:MAG: hypothetical protein IJK67_06920 [Bacilli bacterium]|nr:hypothetical protein [Bacilli bacterium]
MKKQILGILLIGILVIGLTGCSNEKNKYDSLKGDWIATTENQNVYQTGANGETSGGKEDYILKCDGNGNYSLNTSNKKIAKGSYSISDKAITFKDDGNMTIGLCKLVDNKELDCSEKSQYAFKYIKVE